MKKITTGGVYVVDESFSEGIEICTTEPVHIFDINTAIKDVTTIVSEPHANISVYAFHKQASEYNRHIHVTGVGAKAHMGVILSADDSADIQAKVIGQLTASNSNVYLHILSCASNNGEIDLDGVVQIDENIAEVSGKILEENIFLGETGKIRGIPSLLVRSNDVEAGHAARIERIPDEKLYYLRSRGIPKDDATVMMLQSTIASVLEPLSRYDQDKHTSLVEDISNQVLGGSN